jgi:hypothetical protein
MRRIRRITRSERRQAAHSIQDAANNRLRAIAKDWNTDRAMPLPESTSFNEFGTIGLSRPQKNLKVPHLQGFPPQMASTQKSVPFTMWSKCN